MLIAGDDGPGRSGRYVLLVEDNPADARLVQALLDEEPADDAAPLCWVQTAADAVAMLQRFPGCRAVLLDLGLPDSEGLSALQWLSRTHGEVPLLVLTGDDREPVGLDAVDAGAQDFLVKGRFDGAVLARSIAYAQRRKQSELERLSRQMRDELTGLPRRALLLDRLDSALQQSERSGGAGALLFVDLDHFKQVNDTQGHAAGDAVLVAVAERLGATVRASDTVARFGGDEFVVLLAQVQDAAAAHAVAAKLLAAVEQPVSFGGATLCVSASVGVTVYAGARHTAESLLQQADEAMYRAKREGRRRVRVG